MICSDDVGLVEAAPSCLYLFVVEMFLRRLAGFSSRAAVTEDLPVHVNDSCSSSSHCYHKRRHMDTPSYYVRVVRLSFGRATPTVTIQMFLRIRWLAWPIFPPSSLYLGPDENQERGPSYHRLCDEEGERYFVPGQAICQQRLPAPQSVPLFEQLSGDCCRRTEKFHSTQ